MKRFDQINVIPFIDIMLVLLAIVLTTATFISQGRLDIAVPNASSKTPPPNDQPLTRLEIDANEVLYFNDQAVEIGELGQEIAALEPQTSIVLRVDKTVPFQQFVSVLDILKQHNMERLSIVTKQAQ